MRSEMRILPAGDAAFLVELDDLGATLALYDDLVAEKPDCVIDMVPAVQTLLVRFDPLIPGASSLKARILAANLAHRDLRAGDMFEIPVTYDGEDLAEVAEFVGMSVETLIRRHTEATYTVAFNGFAPGFNYMLSDDFNFDIPRRTAPRVRIPAGSVALAGKFGGIYPSDSPGGWQLLGVTSMKMWDTSRDRAALLAPGDRVRFRDVAKSKPVSMYQAQSVACIDRVAPAAGKGVGLVVTRADRPALFQDIGRDGHASQGVSDSGALDRRSLADANICVGNPADAAAIEILYGGFAFRSDRAVTIAVTGAICPIEIRSPAGAVVAAPFGQAFALDQGDELTIGAPGRGMRSYLALRGGFAVETVLGSASTDTLAKLGPAPIQIGDMLIPAEKRAGAVSVGELTSVAMPRSSDCITLDVVLGPRADWFTPDALANLQSSEWNVTAESSRIGIRLQGAQSLERKIAGELASEGTVAGSVQVPHSGQPVLFLADHPLTGGYPVIAVVARHHLDLAGQLPIGSRIRFRAISETHEFTEEKHP